MDGIIRVSEKGELDAPKVFFNPGHNWGPRGQVELRVHGNHGR
jgi:hypothetical protein